MLVSIIVPFYNVEPYFRRCLDSIVNQSYRDLEIILVNDCSPDRSIDIAREYAQTDSRIKIIEHTENRRQGGARNSGMAVAKGEYIWFIDSDDEITTPYAIEHLVTVAKRDNAEVIIFNAIAVYEDKKFESSYCFYSHINEQIFNKNRYFFPVFSDILMHQIKNQGYFGAESCLRFFKMSFLRLYHFTFLEHTLHEDLPHLALLPLAENITILPYVYYNYYQRQGSTMQTALPIDYLEHLDRLVKQVEMIYQNFWIGKDLNKAPLTTLMCAKGFFYTFRLLNSLDKKKNRRIRDSIMLSYYDLLAHHANTFMDDLGNMNWPRVLDNQQQWRIILASFKDNSITSYRKIKLIQNLMQSPALSMKNSLKMLLPHGLALWLLDKRGWKVQIKPKDS